MQAPSAGNNPTSPNPEDRRESDRITVMRPCPYEMTELINNDIAVLHRGSAVCLNMSEGGMCLLMPDAPKSAQVFSVLAPALRTKEPAARPVEVRWIRPSSPDEAERMYFVGVKFLVK
jgi:c-di-GMP-binding flagellar brake protein YcgR